MTATTPHAARPARRPETAPRDARTEAERTDDALAEKMAAVIGDAVSKWGCVTLADYTAAGIPGTDAARLHERAVSLHAARAEAREAERRVQ